MTICAIFHIFGSLGHQHCRTQPADYHSTRRTLGLPSFHQVDPLSFRQFFPATMQNIALCTQIIHVSFALAFGATCLPLWVAAYEPTRVYLSVSLSVSTYVSSEYSVSIGELAFFQALTSLVMCPWYYPFLKSILTFVTAA
jgi:hypothetical protein